MCNKKCLQYIYLVFLIMFVGLLFVPGWSTSIYNYTYYNYTHNHSKLDCLTAL